jgi:hypothetical protein
MKVILSFLKQARDKLLGRMEWLDKWQSKLETLPTISALDATAKEISNNLNFIMDQMNYNHFNEKIFQQKNSNRLIIDHSKTIISRIAFLIHNLELINHYKNIWDLLPKGSFDIILHNEAIIADKGIFSHWQCSLLLSSEIITSNTKYLYLVSNHPIATGKNPLIKQLAIINVRFMYSAGKSGWNAAIWNNLYDVILCFGPYHASVFASSTDAYILQMGYPRFDKFFTTKPDIETLQKKYKCDPAKKTVVWLPTWKTLSSVGWFDSEISLLAAHYNVVVKLHPMMQASEPERVAALKQYNFTYLITDTSDNLPLYQLADFMLFDYGGPPLAAIYVDKNLILLNVPGAETEKLAGVNSPDVSIRKYLISVNSIEKRISAVLADTMIWEKQKTMRLHLRKYYFAPHFGFSSKIAAETLLALHHIVPTQKQAQSKPQINIKEQV